VTVLAVSTTDEMAFRLLRATRDQLHGNPLREVHTLKAAEDVGVDPYRIEYVRILGYLLDHGYLESCPYYPPGLYKVTHKGIEEILRSH
jgi:hypothetical protein